MLDRVELRQLEAFLAVAEELHFGRAAARLHLAQSGVSQMVRALERELGVALFDRTSRRVRLTAAGERLRFDAEDALAAVRRARRNAEAVARGEVGYVRLAAVSSAWLGIIPHLLRVARQQHPALQLSVVEMSTTAQIAALLDHRLDIGFGRFVLPQPGIRSARLIEEPLLVALPTGHRLATLRRIHLGELANEELALFPRQFAPAYFDHLTALCLRAGFSPRISHECTGDQAQLALVAAGLCVALVAASTASRKVPGIRFLPVDQPAASVPLDCVVAESHRTPALSRLLSSLRQAVPEAAERLGVLSAVAQPGAGRRVGIGSMGESVS
jgi:DNA-binding transcriptional LysR family regulator